MEANSGWARILTIEGLAGLVASENPRLAVRAATVALVLRSAVGRAASIRDPCYLSAWLDPARRALGQRRGIARRPNPGARSNNRRAIGIRINAIC
jgi:hypothetical protein